MRLWTLFHIHLQTVIVLGAASMLGCDGADHEHVTGHVTFYETGEPLVAARVVAYSSGHGVSADGVTDHEGHYSLGTVTPGDGLPPGEYQVLESPSMPLDPDEVSELPIDAAFMSFDTSGLILQVDAGATQFDIQVRRPNNQTLP